MLKKKWQSPWLINVDSAFRTGAVTSHQHHRHHLALERGLPFGGAYYWIPTPDGAWSVLVFPNAFYEGGEASHVEIWEEVIHIVSGLYHLKGSELIEQIGNCPYGLPRGRVVQMGDGQWGVAHGGDHPVGTDLESTISEGFCLTEICPKFFLDEHEQTLPGDQRQVARSLAIPRSSQ